MSDANGRAGRSPEGTTGRRTLKVRGRATGYHAWGDAELTSAGGTDVTVVVCRVDRTGDECPCQVLPWPCGSESNGSDSVSES